MYCLERELHQSLGDSLDLGMKVSRIQLETSNNDNPSSTLVVAHRYAEGEVEKNLKNASDCYEDDAKKYIF